MSALAIFTHKTIDDICPLAFKSQTLKSNIITS